MQRAAANNTIVLTSLCSRQREKVAPDRSKIAWGQESIKYKYWSSRPTTLFIYGKSVHGYMPMLKYEELYTDAIEYRVAVLWEKLSINRISLVMARYWSLIMPYNAC